MSSEQDTTDTKTEEKVPKLKIKKRVSKSAAGRTNTEEDNTKLNRAKTSSNKPGWNRVTKIETSLKEMSLVSGIRETQENIDALSSKPYVNTGYKKVSKKKKKQKEEKTDKYVFRKESEVNKEDKINLRQRRKSDSSASTYSDSGKLPNTVHMIDQTTLNNASKENEKSVPEAAPGFNFTVREPANYTGFYTQFDSLYTNLLRHENLIEDEADYKYFVRAIKKDIHSYVKARNREENFNLVHRDVYNSFKNRIMDLEERFKTNSRKELKNAYSNRSSHRSRSRHVPINTNEPTYFADNESFFYVKK